MIKSYAHLEEKMYSDGKMIENKNIEMNYDGENISVDVSDNGEKKHVVITKDDIMKVFSQPMHYNNLMARLKLDFKSNKKGRSTRKDKSKKHGKTSKKHGKTSKKHGKTSKKH